MIRCALIWKLSTVINKHRKNVKHKKQVIIKASICNIRQHSSLNSGKNVIIFSLCINRYYWTKFLRNCLFWNLFHRICILSKMLLRFSKMKQQQYIQKSLDFKKKSSRYFNMHHIGLANPFSYLILPITQLI